MFCDRSFPCQLGDIAGFSVPLSFRSVLLSETSTLSFTCFMLSLTPLSFLTPWQESASFRNQLTSTTNTTTSSNYSSRQIFHSSTSTHSIITIIQPRRTGYSETRTATPPIPKQPTRKWYQPFAYPNEHDQPLTSTKGRPSRRVHPRRIS